MQKVRFWIERSDRDGQHGYFVAGRRVNHVKREGDCISDERPKDMADQKDVRAVSRITIGCDVGRNKVVHKPVERRNQFCQFSFHGICVAFCEVWLKLPAAVGSCGARGRSHPWKLIAGFRLRSR
jgi:hypothetical protein